MNPGIFKNLTIAVLTGFAVSCSSGNDDEQVATYKITVTATEGGTATANKNTCTQGEEVIVAATANESFLFPGWYENEEAVATDAVHTFVMPAEMSSCRLASNRMSPQLRRLSIWG